MNYDWGTGARLARARIESEGIDKERLEGESTPWYGYLPLLIPVALVIFWFCFLWHVWHDYSVQKRRTAELLRQVDAQMAEYRAQIDAIDRLQGPSLFPHGLPMCPPGQICSVIGVMPQPEPEITYHGGKYRWDGKTSSYRHVWDI